VVTIYLTFPFPPSNWMMVVQAIFGLWPGTRASLCGHSRVRALANFGMAGALAGFASHMMDFP
jgi:hypothetical protein